MIEVLGWVFLVTYLLVLPVVGRVSFRVGMRSTKNDVIRRYEGVGCSHCRDKLPFGASPERRAQTAAECRHHTTYYTDVLFTSWLVAVGWPLVVSMAVVTLPAWGVAKLVTRETPAEKTARRARESLAAERETDRLIREHDLLRADADANTHDEGEV